MSFLNLSNMIYLMRACRTFKDDWVAVKKKKRWENCFSFLTLSIAYLVWSSYKQDILDVGLDDKLVFYLWEFFFLHFFLSFNHDIVQNFKAIRKMCFIMFNIIQKLYTINIWWYFWTGLTPFFFSFFLLLMEKYLRFFPQTLGIFSLLSWKSKRKCI